MALAGKLDFDHTAVSPPTGGVNAIEANDGGTSVLKQAFGVPKMGGDSGSGGSAGVAPAPGAGDAAAGKFLKADGTWAVPSGTANFADEESVASASPYTGADWTLAHAPSPAASLQLFHWNPALGWVLLKKGILSPATGQYSLSGSTIITLDVFAEGDLLAWYRY